MRVKEYKNKNINYKKGTRPVYFTTTWGRHRWNDFHQIWQGYWNAWPNHPIQSSNQLIHKCGFGKWLKFHVLALLRRSPLTRLKPCRAACDTFCYAMHCNLLGVCRNLYYILAAELFPLSTSGAKVAKSIAPYSALTMPHCHPLAAGRCGGGASCC